MTNFVNTDTVDFASVQRELSVPVHYAPPVDTIRKASKSQKAKVEYLQCLVLVQPGDDAILITLTPLDHSQGVFSSKRAAGKMVTAPAISKGVALQIETKIPSLISVDGDVMKSFIDNLISCARIDHDEKTGVNIVSIV